jgi:hypothetical protein
VPVFITFIFKEVPGQLKVVIVPKCQAIVLKATAMYVVASGRFRNHIPNVYVASQAN